MKRISSNLMKFSPVFAFNFFFVISFSKNSSLAFHAFNSLFASKISFFIACF